MLGVLDPSSELSYQWIGYDPNRSFKIQSKTENSKPFALNENGHDVLVNKNANSIFTVKQAFCFGMVNGHSVGTRKTR